MPPDGLKIFPVLFKTVPLWAFEEEIFENRGTLLISVDFSREGDILVFPETYPLPTFWILDLERTFAAILVWGSDRLILGLRFGCLADRDIFPNPLTFFWLSATLEMRRAWSCLL